MTVELIIKILENNLPLMSTHQSKNSAPAKSSGSGKTLLEITKYEKC